MSQYTMLYAAQNMAIDRLAALALNLHSNSFITTNGNQLDTVYSRSLGPAVIPELYDHRHYSPSSSGQPGESQKPEVATEVVAGSGTQSLNYFNSSNSDYRTYPTHVTMVDISTAQVAYHASADAEAANHSLNNFHISGYA